MCFVCDEAQSKLLIRWTGSDADDDEMCGSSREWKSHKFPMPQRGCFFFASDDVPFIRSLDEFSNFIHSFSCCTENFQVSSNHDEGDLIASEKFNVIDRRRAHVCCCDCVNDVIRQNRQPAARKKRQSRPCSVTKSNEMSCSRRQLRLRVIMSLKNS